MKYFSYRNIFHVKNNSFPFIAYICNLCFKIVLRMINSLQMVNPNYQHYQDRAVQIRSLVEFRYMIEPYNIDAIENLCRHYLQYGINTLGLINPLHRLLVINLVYI